MRRAIGTITFSITIERLSHEGRGIGSRDGRTVFVTGALPGEQVEARLLRRRAGIAEAVMQSVTLAAPNRVTPPCRYADLCGGCSLQHLAPDEQLAHKQAVLLELLAHHAGIEPRVVLEPLRGPTLGYRSKARLAAKFVAARGGVLIGFREKSGRHLTDMAECPVLQQRIGTRIAALRDLMNGLSVVAKVPQIEVAIAGPRAILVLRHLEPITEADRDRLRAFGAANELEFWLQSGGADSAQPLDGATTPLEYTVDGLNLEFLPSDFTQVNMAINAAMVRQAIEQLRIEPGDSVVDLYCGIGNFSLPIARQAGRVVGFEGDRALVARAGANATRNGITNASFAVADLAMSPNLIAPALAKAVKVLLDPPRTGAAEILKTADFRRIERLVYVSCNPMTLARDVGLLTRQHGFTLAAAGVMDMFPHTAHVESMAVFER